MLNKLHAQPKNTQKLSSVSSETPVQGISEPRSLVVQQKQQENLQQPNLTASLIRTQHYGHHLDRIQPSSVNTSTPIQALPARKRDNGVEGVANITAKAKKAPWWTHPDPGSNYVTDEQGRTILAVHRIDGPQSPGRKKKKLSSMKVDGMKTDDHKGHLGAESSARDTDRMNTPYNIIPENGRHVNQSVKRKFEKLAERMYLENPNSKTYTAHEPLYRGEGKRPVAVTHSIMNDKGETLHSETILNKSKFEMHIAPDNGGTSFFRKS